MKELSTFYFAFVGPYLKYWNIPFVLLLLSSLNDNAHSFVVFKLLGHVQLCHPMNCSRLGFPVLHHLLELAQTHVHWVSDAIQPSHSLSSLLLLPSTFPSIRVFSNASVLCIRWPKYSSFSFSISLSNELNQFRLDFL